MDDRFTKNEKTMNDLSDEIMRLSERMVLLYDDIRKVAKYHRECQLNP